MCYSAQIKAEHKKYVRAYGADIDIEEYFELIWRRRRGAKLKIPKAVELSFADPQTEEERRIKALIDETAAEQAWQWAYSVACCGRGRSRMVVADCPG